LELFPRAFALDYDGFAFQATERGWENLEATFNNQNFTWSLSVLPHEGRMHG